MHVSPGGQPPRHKGNSPPHGSNGLVVVVGAWVVGVVVDVDVVVGGVVRLVVVSGTVAVVVVVDVDVVRGVVLLVVGVGDAVARNVASTMFQLVAEPKVRLPTCGPPALDRMSSRSEASLPLCTSRRYGTLWLLPGISHLGWPPVRTAATTSSPAGTGAVGPTLA